MGRGYDGNLRAETGFGDLNVSGRFDNLRLKTGFGDVTASVNSGSRTSDDWEFSSGFGDVRVNLPENFNASLSEDSGFGGVSTDFPLADGSERHHSHLHSVIGSGGPTVRASTGFGSVHIGRT